MGVRVGGEEVDKNNGFDRKTTNKTLTSMELNLPQRRYAQVEAHTRNYNRTSAP